MITAVVALTLLIPTAAWAGEIGETNFNDPTVTTFDGLGLPFFNWAPLLVDGHTIETDSGVVRYMSMGPGNCIGECIGSNTDRDHIDIVLGDAKRRVGLWVGVSAATVVFFDESDAQLGSVDVTPVEGVAMDFAGWESDAGLISRVRVIDTETNSMAVFIDNLMVEDSSGGTPTDQVEIDIRPGSGKNQINLSGRIVPVAILTTASFDASTVDPSSVTLAEAPVHVNGKGSPSSSLADIDGDGDQDLLLRIEIREMTLEPGDVEATLVGLTYSGVQIAATDSVQIVP